MINFSSPTSHMPTSSLKDLYHVCIKEAVVNVHTTLKAKPQPKYNQIHANTQFMPLQHVQHRIYFLLELL